MVTVSSTDSGMDETLARPQEIKMFFQKPKVRSIYLHFALLLMCALLIAPSVLLANQVGINFSEDGIGGLGDIQFPIGESLDFEADAQVQKSESEVPKLITNVSVTGNVGGAGKIDTIGIKPFVSYTRDTIGNTLDAGGLLNFSIGGIDIAAGASFRGANPGATPLEKRWLADNSAEVDVHGPDYAPNAYRMPSENNINLAVLAGFEKKRVETDLTLYLPITKRDIVPVVAISRSQTSLDIPFIPGLALSFAVDARTYIHADGIEVAFTPYGGGVYRW